MPAEPAIVDGTTRWTAADVEAEVGRVANALLATDLGPDRRIAVYAGNCGETALAHVAGLRGSCSVVPVSHHLAAPEAAFILRDSGTRLLFVGPGTVDRGRAAAAEAGGMPVVAWGGDQPGVEQWAAFDAGAPPAAAPLGVAPRPNLMYTSGTTGRPKGTLLPPPMFAGGATMAEHLDAIRRTNRFAGFGRHLVAGPLHHTGPLQAVRLLAVGVPITVLDRFDAEAVLVAIERDRVETSVMVPTHFVRLLALPDSVKARYDLSSLRLVAHTGAPCPPEVKRAMIEWWGPVFVDAYGATESGTVCQITSEEWLARPGSVGRPINGFDVVVVDDGGRPCAAGETGRLFFRHPTGRGIVYHGDPEASAAVHLEPGLFTLGEIGHVDEEGYVFITDRATDMVLSGGVNLYPAEAEAVLVQHPGVADVAVIGIPHPEMGEELKALVVALDPQHPPAPGDVLAFCRARLTAMKCPRTVELVESLDRTAMGKLDKRALRARYGRSQP